LQLSGAVSSTDVSLMRSHIWEELESRGVMFEDRSTWPSGATTGFKQIKKSDPNPLENNLLRAAIDELVSREWKLRPDWGQALVTFPIETPWRVPGGNWHLDHHPYQTRDQLTGVNVFLLLDELESHGGGTAVLEASPALIQRFNKRNPELREENWAVWKNGLRASDEYLKRLTDKNEQSPTFERNAFFTKETVVGDIPVRVSEIVGDAGDVIICHPQLLHSAPGGNECSRPRLMRTLRVYW
jgi:hypothetical protein